MPLSNGRPLRPTPFVMSVDGAPTVYRCGRRQRCRRCAILMAKDRSCNDNAFGGFLDVRPAIYAAGHARSGDSG